MFLRNKSLKVFSVITGTTLLLGACGGGGGGTGAVVPGRAASVGTFLSSASVSSLTSVTETTSGKALTVVLDGDLKATGSREEDATFSLGSFNGTSAIEVSAGGTSTGALNQATGTPLGLQAGKDNIDLYGRRTADSAYGLIVTEQASTGGNTLTAFHTGHATVNMPVNATASYSGAFRGAVNKDNQGFETVSGSMTMNADFAAGTVSGRSSSIQGADVVVNGAISGSTYTGTAQLVQSGTNISAGAVNSSNLSGGFYGTNARETTGAVTIDQNVAGVRTTVVGAFGASR